MINISRKTKNIIASTLLVILVGINIFTVYLAKNNIESNLDNTNNTTDNVLMQNNNDRPPGRIGGNGNFKGGNREEVPPDLPYKNDIEDNSSTNNDNNRGTPPNRDREDDYSDEFAMDGENPPEMPGEFHDTQVPNNIPSDIDDNFNPPSIPEKENPILGDNIVENQQNNSLSTPYYIFLGIESFLISAILMYLIMSSYNKKSFKELLKNKKTILILCFSTILLTIGLLYCNIFLVSI